MEYTRDAQRMEIPVRHIGLNTGLKYGGTRDVSWIALNKELKERERDDRRCHKSTHPCPVDEVIGKVRRSRNVPFTQAGVEIAKCSNWRTRLP